MAFILPKRKSLVDIKLPYGSYTPERGGLLNNSGWVFFFTSLRLCKHCIFLPTLEYCDISVLEYDFVPLIVF